MMYTSECKAGAHEVRGTLSLLFDDCSGGVPCSIVPRGSWKAGQFGESVPCIIMMLNAEIVQRKKINPFCPVVVNSEQIDS